MNRLREFREAAGLTQDRLAAKAHTTQNRIAELERDLQPWRSEACALAMALGVKTEKLFPDGFKVKKDYNNGPESHQPEKMYEPDPELAHARPRLSPPRLHRHVLALPGDADHASRW